MTPKYDLGVAAGNAPQEPFWTKAICESITDEDFSASSCCNRAARQIGFGESPEWGCGACKNTFTDPVILKKATCTFTDENGAGLQVTAMAYPPASTFLEEDDAIVSQDLRRVKFSPQRRDPTSWYVHHIQLVSDTVINKPTIK